MPRAVGSAHGYVGRTGDPEAAARARTRHGRKSLAVTGSTRPDALRRLALHDPNPVVGQAWLEVFAERAGRARPDVESSLRARLRRSAGLGLTLVVDAARAPRLDDGGARPGPRGRPRRPRHRRRRRPRHPLARVRGLLQPQREQRRRLHAAVGRGPAPGPVQPQARPAPSLRRRGRLPDQGLAAALKKQVAPAAAGRGCPAWPRPGSSGPRHGTGRRSRRMDRLLAAAEAAGPRATPPGPTRPCDEVARAARRPGDTVASRGAGRSIARPVGLARRRPAQPARGGRAAGAQDPEAASRIVAEAVTSTFTWRMRASRPRREAATVPLAG